MAALAAEGITIHPSPPVRPIVAREDSYVSTKELDTATPSAENLPKLSFNESNRLEELHVQDVEVTVSQRVKVLRELSCYLSLYISGYNCGVTGTLLPSIEEVYHLSYSTVSLLFASFCFGYLFSAFGSGKAIKKWGFGKVLVGAGLIMMAGIIIDCAQLVSFPLMCFAFVIVGCGFSTQLGMSNSYFATLPRSMLRMGVLHGFFGFGAFTSPIVASTMISHGVKLNFFYLTSLGLIIPSIVISYFAFVHGAARYDKLPDEVVIIADPNSHKRDSLREIAARKDVWILSFFLLFYVGAEESTGGWIVSYMEVVRHGNAGGAAWVASGFYLGLAIGRVCLPIVNHMVGERRIVFIYIVCAGALQAVSWAVKSFAATAIATAFIGFAISTFYTACIHTASRLLPRRMHTTAMVMISSIGQSGSAIFPFVIGLISNKKGIWVVQPAIVSLLAAQFICWLLVPRIPKHTQ